MITNCITFVNRKLHLDVNFLIYESVSSKNMHILDPLTESLATCKKFWSLAIQIALTEDSDQTAMRRLM